MKLNVDNLFHYNIIFVNRPFPQKLLILCVTFMAYTHICWCELLRIHWQIGVAFMAYMYKCWYDLLWIHWQIHKSPDGAAGYSGVVVQRHVRMVPESGYEYARMLDRAAPTFVLGCHCRNRLVTHIAVVVSTQRVVHFLWIIHYVLDAS